jgi:hypothetical protein
MFRKTLIAATVLAISPAIAFAAPMTTAPTAKPAITQTVKAEKVKIVKVHHTAKKVKIAAHLHLKAKPKVNKV